MPDIPTLTEQQATAFRLHRHGLTGNRSALNPGRLASSICGAQAQVLSAAQLSLAIRSHSITPDIVAGELWRRRTLAKVWSMRSTLHLHAAADLPLYLGGLAIWRRSIEKWLSRNGIEGRQLDRIHTLLRRDLSHARNAALDAGAVVALPYFDTYMLGHRTKDHLLEPGRYKSVYRSAGWIASVVLIDGRVAGTWTSEARGGEHVVRVVPHVRMNRATKGRIMEAMEKVVGYTAVREVRVVIGDEQSSHERTPSMNSV